ncbi:FecR domain-containing protein [Reichenbachiella carrageenanivorans]|uniref:FecR domain-containing protein n=1 Tax=Reichenbachiella carrageenanivorans TaxID=2979869 RepID=A0ABY6D0B4_9BACT|nr:FecR domain-containing protein [Reichenbachiella carrageenanivorans]UXX79538.1 FecR domain-containing protein [Reichenbachiella carrageenanivorans]
MDNKHIDKDQILAQWLNGELTTKEAKTHLAPEEFSKYQQIISEVGQWVPAHDQQVFDPQEILKSKKEAKVVRMSIWQYASIAAAILLALFVGPILYQSLTTVSHETAFGEMKTISLPDGSSSIMLSANSKVSWKKSHWRKGKRLLTLSGKAYIDVPQKGAFDVITEAGTVSVLGTRFVVHQIDEVLHAQCYEGRVRASNPKGKSIEISQGESSLFFNGKWSPKELFDLDFPEWIKDHISFTNTPIKLVLDELHANYGLTIKVGQVNLARRFTGSIPKDDLDQSLKIIFPTLGIDYRLEDNTLYLSE